MKAAWGNVTDRVLLHLAEAPSTAADMREELELSVQVMSAVLCRLMHATKTMPKRIRVVRWIYEADGERTYPRAVYELGDKPDARKPKRDHPRVQRLYRARKKAAVMAVSVFRLGMPSSHYTRADRREKAAP